MLKLDLAQLKALVTNHELLGGTDRPLYFEAMDKLEPRIGRSRAAAATQGSSERSRASHVASWTSLHGKDDAANPFSKQNTRPRPK
jgi:hypothetical protein